MGRLSVFAVILIAGLVLWWQQPDSDEHLPSGASSTTTEPLVLSSVEVRDLDGRVAWRGDVDLAPVLARIEAGERDPHRNDGSVFQNREGRLPQRPRGHYREYVVRTPGIRHAGPQRLVLGADGEIYYTADHYRSFQRLR